VDRGGALFEAVGRYTRDATGFVIAGAWRRLQLYPWREDAPTLATQATVVISAIAFAVYLIFMLGR
jgi:hypothetical protein